MMVTAVHPLAQSVEDLLASLDLPSEHLLRDEPIEIAPSLDGSRLLSDHTDTAVIRLSIQPSSGCSTFIVWTF